MSKDAKPAAKQDAGATESTGAPAKKSKKKLILIIVAVIVLLGAGAAGYLLMKPVKHLDPVEAAAAKEKAEHEALLKNPPKFVDLGTFTANLVQEDSDRYLQTTISLKITKPELEERIKANSPEILHHVNMVLQSKRASELSTLEGKRFLAAQIKGQVEYVLGLRKTPPAIRIGQTEEAPIGARKINSDIAEVLFTSFIIQ